MPEKKYTIQLTEEELYWVKACIWEKSEHYYEDYIEDKEGEEREEEEHNHNVLKKLLSRLEKKWNKLKSN